MTQKEYLNILFNRRSEWHMVPDEVKRQYHYVLNRMMGRVFPAAADALNRKHQDPATAADVWFFALKKLNGQPSAARFVPDKRPDPRVQAYLYENGISESDLKVLALLDKSRLEADMKDYFEVYDAIKDDALYKKEPKAKKK